ncbi:sigma-70 family RNA polymerase sigma factor [Silvibacterium acidisoli]|uniref:sigma-70 family RNA polymerase sigma factor n=1 Tax=Acidobacteriaceae bacterium ZG23-2 TaxID=2883246 RepID=UPI00406BE8F8
MAIAAEARDEAGMIAAIVAGDSQLFHELIRPYERSVYVMAFSMMKNEADAEDVAQEAFLKAFRNLAGFRADAKFSTWLITIMLNEARNRLRRSSTAKTESLDDTDPETGSVSPAVLVDWREIPSETLERAEVRSLLENAVKALPEIYRQVFLLRDVEGFSVSEAAEALKISEVAVKVRLHRARMMLQKALAPVLKSMTPARRRWFSWS